jgi:hypothetical protein
MSKSSAAPAGQVVATSLSKAGAMGNNVMEVPLAPGENPDVALAKARLHPVVNAGHTIRVFEKTLADHPFGSLVTELSRHVKDVRDGNMKRPEAMLMMQAHSLDAIFNTLAQRAGANIGSNADAAERYLRMALKAQSQCRTTLEALSEIKHPKSTTFVKQANIAQQQQVNNGPIANGATAPTHERNITPNKANELLEEQHGQRLDGRTPGAAIRADSHMEAVAAVDRATDCGRKNAQ